MQGSVWMNYIYFYITYFAIDFLKRWLPLYLNWKRIQLQCRRPQFYSWVGKIHWGRDILSTPVFLGFPGGPAGKESACIVGDLVWIPGLGRSPEGKGYPLQYSGQENFMDCITHGVPKSWTRLRNFLFSKDILETIGTDLPRK